MLARRRSPILAILVPVAFSVGLGAHATPEPARLVVRNATYSSLRISVVDADGRETALGQAPPEFSNTLVIRDALLGATVRFQARLAGDTDVLYRSDAIRLTPGVRVRWLLPENSIER